MEQKDSLQTTLQSLIPKTLDDVFRANREIGQLTLATDAELTQMKGFVEDAGIRHTLTDWQILSVRLHIDGQVQVSPRLVGSVQETGQFWMTSYVLSVDLEQGLIKTRNSVYRVIGHRMSARTSWTSSTSARRSIIGE